MDAFYNKQQLQHLDDAVEALQSFHYMMHAINQLNDNFIRVGRRAELSRITGDVGLWASSQSHISWAIEEVHRCYVELLTYEQLPPPPNQR